MKSLFNAELKKITRPTGANYCQEEGVIAGRIESANLEERESRYSETGKRDVLIVKTTAFSKAGDVDLTHMVTFNWADKSKMVDLLRKLDLLPAPGCDLELDAFAGMAVEMTIENVEKNGRIFSNVINMRRQQVLNKSSVEVQRLDVNTGSNLACYDIDTNYCGM